MTAPGRLFPSALRISPQLASLELLVQSAEVSIIALCAAHPAIESERADLIRIDQLADRIVDRAMALLNSIDHYRLLLAELDRLAHAIPPEDEIVF